MSDQRPMSESWPFGSFAVDDQNKTTTRRTIHSLTINYKVVRHMAQPVHLTDETFTPTINEGGVVLVDFWAAWCGPCRIIAPIIDELAGEYAGKATIAKVDVDNNPRVAMEYGIRSIPSLLVFKGGKVVDTIVGAVPKPYITERLEQQLA